MGKNTKNSKFTIETTPEGFTREAEKTNRFTIFTCLDVGSWALRGDPRNKSRRT